MIRQHPDRFQLLVVQQVRFVARDNRGAPAFGVFGGEGVGGLRDHGGGVEAGDLETCEIPIDKVLSMPPLVGLS